MTKPNSDSGFSVVEVLLILVIVGILGFTGWYVYHAKQISNKNYSANSSIVPAYKKKTSTDTPASIDPYSGWKQYCSDAGSACFKYPTTWSASPSESEDPNISGLTLTSPGKTTLVTFNPVIGGLGGACEPGICSFNTTSIETPSDASAQNLRIVKGVFESRDSGYVATPMYCVTDASYVSQVGLKLGELNVGLIYLNFHNPNKDQIENFCVTSSTPAVHPTSLQAAQNWLSGSEVNTAGKILDSIQLK